MGLNELVHIGSRIKELRKKRGFTQREIAKKLSIPVSTYSNYENDNREPSGDMIAKIAAALEISIVDLMGWDEQYPNIGTDCVLYEKALETNTPFGKAVTLLAQLNEDGQAKAIAYMQDLLKIESYCIPENEK